MHYKKADDIFPKELLSEIQKHVKGELVYIPNPEGKHRKWGEKSGYKDYLNQRNHEIKLRFRHGIAVDDLAKEFFLSCETIKRIVYSRK